MTGLIYSELDYADISVINLADMRQILIISALCTLLNTNMFAHGGHSALQSHIWHYLVSHGLFMPAVMGLLLVLLVVGYKMRLREFVRVPSHKHNAGK